MQLPGEFFSIYRKKVVFCLVVGGVTPPPYPLSGPTTKKNTFFFMCVFLYLICHLFNPNKFLFEIITPMKSYNIW